MLTTKQMRERSKTVTRRLGWANVMVGEEIQAVLQCQGLKKGEKITKLCVIRVLDARWERLFRITKADCVLEGFPDLSPWQFIDLFCKANKCDQTVSVNRILFEYKEDVPRGH